MLAKHAAHCRHFNWYYSLLSVLLYAPLAGYLVSTQPPQLTLAVLACLLSTGVLHVAYPEVLQAGYRAADLSVVYPVARGSGPLLTFFGAIVLLQERPSALALLGALLVMSGVFLIAGGPSMLKKAGARSGLYWGVVIGIAIACYTLVDGYGVKALLIAPPLIDYAGNVFRALLLFPRAHRDWPRARSEWTVYWRQALGVAILGPFAYIMVLYAMRLAPISQVAPAREMSMMIGAYFGARVFNEEARHKRLAAAALIVLGVAALTVG
jgi:drug/metabolite transporter (DMT)-like permease